MPPTGVVAALQLFGEANGAVRAAGCGPLVIRAGVVKRQPQVRWRVLERHQVDEVFPDFIFEQLRRHRWTRY
jgi:hypothetical protein